MTAQMTVDGDRLNELLGRVIGDIGATTTAGGVVVGHRLGLYGALARGGPATPEELAARTDTDARYVAEWLRGQAAGGYVEYDPATGRFSLTPEQAFALADPDGPLYLPGAFVLALGALRAEPRITEAFRTGAGIGWHEHDDDVVPRLRAVLPARLRRQPGRRRGSRRSTGVEEKLAAGARVADVGCGLGASTVLIAQAFPEVSVVGSDYHDGSIELARKRAADAGVADRVTFEVASAQTFAGSGYDLVTTFDCLHDMGDPLGAARRIRDARRRRRHLDGRRAPRGRPRRGQPQPGRPCLLRVLDVPLRTQRPLPARRLQPRRPGRRGRRAADRDRRRVHPVPAGGRDAVQQRLRGTTVVEEEGHAGTTAGHRRSDRTGRGARRVRGVRAPGRDRRRGAPDARAADLVGDRAHAAVEVPGARARPAVPGGHRRGPGQRRRGPAEGAGRLRGPRARRGRRRRDGRRRRRPGGARRAVDGRAARAAARGVVPGRAPPAS